MSQARRTGEVGGWLDPLGRSGGAAAGVGLALVMLALGLFWPAADFPFEYHNDEPSKVEQIQTGTRNLRHPVLMLAVVDGVVGWAGVREDGQAVARVGRTMSGLAMAVAVAGLGSAVALVAGWLPGLLAGVLALARPWFFEASQMFKEDAWHLATLGLVVWVAVLWGRRAGAEREMRWAVVLGVALGLAVSARYYAAVPAVLVLGWIGVRGGGWWGGVWGAGLAGVGVFAVLHLPWVGDAGLARAEIGREVEFFTRGHFGVGEVVPHSHYWEKWKAMAGPLPWFLVGMALVAGVVRRRWAMLAGVVGVWAYVVVLSWSPKFSDRYFLPVEWAWCGVLGVGLGVVGWVLFRLVRAWGDRLAVGVVTVVLLGLGGRLVVEPWEEVRERKERFQRDDRRELAVWMEQNLPAESRWVEDDQARIRSWLPGRTVAFSEFVVDLGEAEEWLAGGVEYAVLCRDRHHRYTARGQVARMDEGGVARMRRERYRRLLEEGEVLWSSPGLDPKALHPGLDLISLAPFGAGAEGEGNGKSDEGEE